MTNPKTKNNLLNLFCSAWYGSSYWACLNADNYSVTTDRDLAVDEMVFEYIWRGGSVEVMDSENPNKLIGTITKQKMFDAVDLMKAAHREHYRDYVNESDDATTADIWLQLATMGEVVFS